MSVTVILFQLQTVRSLLTVNEFIFLNLTTTAVVHAIVNLITFCCL